MPHICRPTVHQTEIRGAAQQGWLKAEVCLADIILKLGLTKICAKKITENGYSHHDQPTGQQLLVTIGYIPQNLANLGKQPF